MKKIESGRYEQGQFTLYKKAYVWALYKNGERVGTFETKKDAVLFIETGNTELMF